ncbi:MAG: aminopeptidase P family protein [Bacillota bacterium]
MKAELFQRNREKFTSLMVDNSLAVFYSNTHVRSTADQFYPFCVDRNFYYFTGIARENMILLFSKIDGQVETRLFIPPVDALYEKWHARFVRDYEAQEISGIAQVLESSTFEASLAKTISTAPNLESIYLFFWISELDEPDNQYRQLAGRIRRQYPAIRFINSQPLMARLRTAKEPEEVAEIKRAIDLTGDALCFVMKQLRPGIFEYEIAAHYQYHLALHNSQARFKTVVASGQNAMMLHYNSGQSQVQDGQLVLMDLGAFSNCYVSDITRTYPVNGKFTPRQRDLYNIVLEAQEVAADAMRAGVSELSVNQAVKRYLAKQLHGLGLIRVDSDVNNYFYHSIGHHIGLDLHDLKVPDKTLVENSVYTVEPGLYLAEEGIGIRIEDNVLVTKSGVEFLSAGIIKTVSDIENFMA